MRFGWNCCKSVICLPKWIEPEALASQAISYWQTGFLGVPEGYNSLLRCVAQPGSALAWGARGRRFESFHTDQFKV